MLNFIKHIALRCALDRKDSLQNAWIKYVLFATNLPVSKCNRSHSAIDYPVGWFAGPPKNVSPKKS